MDVRTLLPLALVAALGLAVAATAAVLRVPDDVEPASTASDDASAPPGLAWEVLGWEGFARTGAADRFAHTTPTEAAVAPLARMGFRIEVPEGASALAFRLDWPAGTEMHLMAHAPHADGRMPTFMGGMDATGTMCIRIPDDHVVPGPWRVMAHTEGTARDLGFTVTTRVEGAEGLRILDGEHGHPFMDGMEAEDVPPVACDGFH